MSRRKPVTRCPCCGQAIPEPLGFRPGLHLGVMQQRLFRVLQRAPDGLTVTDCVQAIYGDRDAPAPNVISVMAKKINTKIAPLGLRIKGSGGPGSVYRLLRQESTNCAS